MISNFEEYIRVVRTKLDRNIFSPLFVRLANLYLLNKQYEECIDVCKTGLEIYPDYLSAKLILLRALINLEYINEAENILKDIEQKISDLEIYNKLKEQVTELKKVSRQERISYPQKRKDVVEFSSYEESFNNTIDKKSKLDFQELKLNWDNDQQEKFIDENAFEQFLANFNKIKFDIQSNTFKSALHKSGIEDQSKGVNFSFAPDIKIVTETLADLYAKQGYFKEAFNAYNMLLRADTSNKERILKKLSELESNYI